MAYSFDMISGGASKLRHQLLKYKHYSCVDFRKFDKIVSLQLIDISFNILEQNISFGKYRNHGVPDGRRLYRAWSHLIDYFKNTLVRLPNGERYQKKTGIPSGSYFTQLIDSIVNYICLTYATLKLTGDKPKYIKVFGDNSVIATRTAIEKFDLARVIDSIDMEINLKKTVITDNVERVEFLGFCIAGGFPQRSLTRWMTSLYSPEFPDSTIDDFQSRALGLLYANHGVEPTFDSICRAVITCSSFCVSLSRDFARFLSHVGIDPKALSCIPPTRRSFLFSLIG